MNTFHKRRILSFLTLAAVAIGYLLVWRDRRDNLQDPQDLSGPFLLMLVLFLIAFHWRKRWSVLPLGPASWWMQLHIYAGLLSGLVYWTHAGLRIPEGWLDRVLAGLFAAVFSSGLAGLYMTRTFPRRMAAGSEPFIFERIPQHRNQLRHSAHQLVLAAVRKHGTSTLADFYQARLGTYFECPRSLGFLLNPTPRWKQTLMEELSSLQRYLSEGERRLSDQLFHLIRKKDDLDYQYSLQLRLKLWIFVHLTLSYSLLLFSLVHVVVVTGFDGGLR